MLRPATPRTAGTRALAGVVDAVLEATVVGSFSRLGPALRRPTAHWSDPLSARDRVVVVTGATSGLGLAAATRLARLGARVWLVGRDPGRLDDARAQVRRAGGEGSEVHTEQADFADLAQVRRLADRLAASPGRVDALLHNAGALFPERRVAADGTELTVTLHLLAPYVLTERLLATLVASAPARVITVTSGGMYTQRYQLGDLVMAPGDYDGTVAYARAKRAQVVLTHEWQRRHGAEGVDFFAVHPGWADTPGLTEGLPGFARYMRPLLRTPAEGADTMVWLAGAPDAAPAGGGLWFDRRPRGEYHLPWTRASAARRTADGMALWEWCRDRTADLAG